MHMYVCYSSNFYYLLKETEKKQVKKKHFFELSGSKIIQDLRRHMHKINA